MSNPPTPTRTASVLRRLTRLRPTLALVLGSGLGGVADAFEEAQEISYGRLSGFPPVGVKGHSARVVVGFLGVVEVMALCGRAHYYEGHAMSTITFPIRVLAEFGVRRVVLTNAAGGINRRFQPGDFMRFTDHINLMGANPLRGETGRERPGFLDLTTVYDQRLGEILQRASRATKVRLHRGVYLAVSGPTYETPAEIRAYARLGADAVGMSTVPEAIVARQCGLAVTGLSCITNLAAGRTAEPLSHSEVLSTGQRVQADAERLLRRFTELQAAASS